MKWEPTQEQRDRKEKEVALHEKAKRISRMAAKNASGRLKVIRKRASNLASLGSADRSELEYEKALLEERLNIIDKTIGG